MTSSWWDGPARACLGDVPALRLPGGGGHRASSVFRVSNAERAGGGSLSFYPVGAPRSEDPPGGWGGLRSCRWFRCSPKPSSGAQSDVGLAWVSGGRRAALPSWLSSTVAEAGSVRVSGWVCPLVPSALFLACLPVSLEPRFFPVLPRSESTPVKDVGSAGTHKALEPGRCWQPARAAWTQTLVKSGRSRRPRRRGTQTGPRSQRLVSLSGWAVVQSGRAREVCECVALATSTVAHVFGGRRSDGSGSRGSRGLVSKDQGPAASVTVRRP